MGQKTVRYGRWCPSVHRPAGESLTGLTNRNVLAIGHRIDLVKVFAMASIQVAAKLLGCLSIYGAGVVAFWADGECFAFLSYRP